MVLTNNSVRRIAMDVKSLINDPIENVYYFHDDSNILLGKLLIIGNKDTPYSFGYNFFNVELPENYPFSPPKLTYLSNDGSMRYHPNLYTCGKVCLSILNTWQGEGWSSCQTLRSIFIILSSILNSDPLTNEPGIRETNPLVEKYNLLTSYKNIEFLICGIVKQINNINTNNIFADRFYQFRDIVNRDFKQNYNNIVDNLNNLELQCKKNNIDKISVSIYHLNYKLNFKYLHTLLHSIKI